MKFIEKKIVVTGGAGFIGSHLCSKLIEQGNSVICIDNLFKGKLANIASLQKNKNFTFLKHDVNVPFPTKIHFHQLYHLASPTSPNIHVNKNVFTDPFNTMKTNTLGTWNLLEACVTNRAQFLFASTSEIYGEPLVHPQTEVYNGNTSTTGLRSIYDEAKRFGETITMAFVRYKQIDARIVRIFNTYGPGMNDDDGRVIGEFMYHAIRNEPLIIFGSGKQSRSFCYVTDIVNGLIKAMNQTKTRGEIINLGNDEEITVENLAKKIIMLSNATSPVYIKHEELPEDEPSRRKPDITKAYRLLKWKPEIALDEGLQTLINRYHG